MQQLQSHVSRYRSINSAPDGFQWVQLLGAINPCCASFTAELIRPWTPRKTVREIREALGYANVITQFHDNCVIVTDRDLTIVYILVNQQLYIARGHITPGRPLSDHDVI